MKSKTPALSFALLLLFVLCVFSACKDDTTEETEEQRRTRQLTSGAFTVVEVTLTPDSEYSFEGPVMINFVDSYSFEIDGAASLPNPSSNPGAALPASGTWSFADTQNYNQIRLTSSGTSVDLSINNLSDNELVFQYMGAEPKPEDEVMVRVRATRN